jgi:glycosyltransferase involved in cell wall biosynthesis
MNVMIVVPWDQARGGVATVVNKLAAHLTDKGHAVSFFHPGASEHPQPKTTQAGYPGFELNLRNPFIAAHPLRSRVAFWLLLPRTLFRLLELLRERQIDIISIHYPLPSFVYFALCRLLLRNRLVVSVHGADLMPDGEYAPRYPRPLRLLLRTCDHLTAPSKHYLESILARFPYLRHRSTAIHNGIDVAEFQDGSNATELWHDTGVTAPLIGIELTEVQHGTRHTAPSILCIAAHNPKKGLDILLQALALVRTRGVALKLVLVGDGPLRPKLEELARQLDLDDQVQFAGFQDLPAVRRHLQQCGLFVLPSRAEPFGIVILEAMIHGKPIITTRVGGIPEIVTHLKDGYLIPPEDPQALAAAICEVAQDSLLRQRLGMAGTATVHERFTYQHTGSKFELLFRDLIMRQDTIAALRLGTRRI